MVYVAFTHYDKTTSLIVFNDSWFNGVHFFKCELESGTTNDQLFVTVWHLERCSKIIYMQIVEVKMFGIFGAGLRHSDIWALICFFTDKTGTK